MVLVLAGWLTIRRRLPSAYGWLLAAGLVVAVLLDSERVQHYGWLFVVFEIVWLITLAVVPSPQRIDAAEPEGRPLEVRSQVRLRASFIGVGIPSRPASLACC